MTTTIRNITTRPLRVSLPGARVLHLGPGHTGQVSDDAQRSPSFRKLVERGEIEVLGEEMTDTARAGNPPHESDAHGHPQPHRVFPSGNR